MKRSFPIALKVDLIIIASLVIGIGGVVSYISFSQYSSALRATDEALRHQSEILYYSIKNLMLPGEAPIARSFLDDMQESAGLGYQIMVYRANGVEAFVDNETIRKVNANNAARGAKLFQQRPEPPATPRTMDPTDEAFSQAAEMGEETIFQTSSAGLFLRTIHTPLLNNPPCAECHGTDHTVRGVIQIKTDVTEDIKGPRRSLAVAGAFLLALVTLLALILTQFMRVSVIHPVKRISEVCANVTRGSFDRKVQLEKRDEIGDLGRTVNTMVDGLFERFELSKFVSSSTIRAIRDGAKGTRTGVTMLFTDVRGFTSYSEKQEPETVVKYLNVILSAQTEIIHRNGGDVDKYVGDEVVAIFTGAGKEMAACRSALDIQVELARNKDRLYGGLSVGAGIDTGDVVLGMIGSEKRADFTVIGDHVNFAARLCAAADPGAVLISESTYLATLGKLVTRGPQGLRVKGKEAEQRVYVLDAIKEETR